MGPQIQKEMQRQIQRDTHTKEKPDTQMYTDTMQTQTYPKLYTVVGPLRELPSQPRWYIYLTSQRDTPLLATPTLHPFQRARLWPQGGPIS